jgi:large subunit ribosomal protein L1
MKATKRVKANNALLTKESGEYSLDEAVDLLKKATKVKFDASVELQLKLGADPNASDQVVRGTTSLPYGTGKKVRVIVISNDERGQEALKEGADHVGGAELIEKILKGWMDFDAVVASPSMMRDVAKLGRVLGPRGLMPSPKAGTVTENVAAAVKEIKKGRIEFKMDKLKNLNCSVGRISFEPKALVNNVEALVSAVAKAKPKGVKGQFIVSAYMSSTMGPGVKLKSEIYRAKESSDE